ncbi:MAG: SgcJ/EcaC family oxidoreductase [Pyrinomonadaceae bacterium]
MKRTTTEILIEVEETVAVRLHKQNSLGDENDIRETTAEQIVCPFCERDIYGDQQIQNKKARNKKMKLKIIAISIIVFCATIYLFAQEKTSKMSKDEAMIRANVKQMETGWNAHDSKAFAAPFAANADYVVVNGMYSKGRDEIEKGHTGIFTTIYKDSRNAPTIRSVRFLRKDVAVVHVEWNLEFQSGGKMLKGHALSTMIMTKDNGKWSIAAFQNTPIQEINPQGGN